LTALTLLLSACAPATSPAVVEAPQSPSQERLDELSSELGGERTLVLGWLEHSPGEAVLEVVVTPDSGEALRWRQDVDAGGRVVGRVSFDQSVSVALRAAPWDAPTPLGEPLALGEAGAGVAELGPALLFWEVGRSLPAPLASVDARPGPPEGWLTPKQEGAPPLVLGMVEADAEQWWTISGRALSSSRKVTRGLGGLVAEGGGVRSRGLVTMEGHAVISISFLLAGQACDDARVDLEAQYGAPNAGSELRGPSWVGGRHRVGMTINSGQCSVGFQPRQYGEEAATDEADETEVPMASGPIAAVDAHPGPPDEWLPTAVEGAPSLVVGMTGAAAVEGGQIQKRSGKQALITGLKLEEIEGRINGSVSLTDGVIQAINILYADPGCAWTRELLEEAYGPMSSEHHLMGTRWSGERAWAGALPSGSKSCVAQWHL